MSQVVGEEKKKRGRKKQNIVLQVDRSISKNVYLDKDTKDEYLQLK